MSGYLPLGADIDSRAPYNQIEKECPMCGATMESYSRSSGRYKWRDYQCPNCGTEEDNEPDWDAMEEERRMR